MAHHPPRPAPNSSTTLAYTNGKTGARCVVGPVSIGAYGFENPWPPASAFATRVLSSLNSIRPWIRSQFAPIALATKQNANSSSNNATNPRAVRGSGSVISDEPFGLQTAVAV